MSSEVPEYYILDMARAYELRTQYQADVVLEQEDCAALIAAEQMKGNLRIDTQRGKEYRCLPLLYGTGKDHPELEHWMATELLQFTKMPQVRAGRVRVPCGRKVGGTEPAPKQEGWASTKPGKTKYHHYDAKGKSKCNYERQPGPLHFAPDPSKLSANECCSACDLHILKAKHPERFNNHPSLPIANQSTWQRKQYDPKPAEPQVEKHAAVAPRTQLSLF